MPSSKRNPNARATRSPTGPRPERSGDLDTILLKALKKEPEDRYPTVGALVDDIERHLDSRPVLARPDRLAYRLSKFARRHAFGMSAGAAVLGAILVGSGAALWQAQVARAEQRRAEEVKAFITSIFNDADPYQGSGTVPSVVDLLTQATTRIERDFAGRPELRVELQNVVAKSLLNLQQNDAAEPVVREAARLARETLGDDHTHTLRARIHLAQLLRFRGQTSPMRVELDETLPRLRLRRGEAPEDFVVALKLLAHLEIDAGRYDEAERTAREAFDAAVRLLGDGHRETAATAIVLALSYVFGHKPDQALEAAQDAYRRVLAVYGGKDTHPKAIRGASGLRPGAGRSRPARTGDCPAVEGHGQRGRRLRAVRHDGRFLRPESGRVPDYGRRHRWSTLEQRARHRCAVQPRRTRLVHDERGQARARAGAPERPAVR
jgi:serine/threonine-protein kinase